MSPATTAPKTSSRMISAAGSPNCSSPFSRSSCESRLKSWSSARSPAIETSNAASSFARLELLDHRRPCRRRRGSRSRRASRARPPRRGLSAPSRYERASRERGRLARRRAGCDERLERGRRPPCTARSGSTTTSVVERLRDRAGTPGAIASIARSDSGLFVGAPSVVRLSAEQRPIAATARTDVAIHAPIVLQGCRALAEAMA